MKITPLTEIPFSEAESEILWQYKGMELFCRRATARKQEDAEHVQGTRHSCCLGFGLCRYYDFYG